MTQLSRAIRARSSMGLMVGLVCLAVLALSVGLLASRASADGPQASGSDSSMTASDLNVAKALIADFKAGGSVRYVVPSGALATVRANQKEIAASNEKPVQADESHAAVLPDSVKADINAEYASVLKKDCTEKFADAQLKTNWGAEADTALFNSPTAEPITKASFDVMAVQQEGTFGGDAVVWALVWSEDETANGPAVESWGVWEYCLSAASGKWRIDGQTLVWHYDDLSSKDWGPTTAHQEGTEGECLGGSVLFANDSLPTDRLMSLQEIAARQ